MPQRLRNVVPHLAMLLISVLLYFAMLQIDTRGAEGGRIGPDFWPRAIIVIMGLLCIYEIAKRLVIGTAFTARGLTDELDRNPAESVAKPRNPERGGPVGNSVAQSGGELAATSAANQEAGRSEAESAPEPQYLGRLMGGIALIAGFALAVDWLGFFVATALFLFLFMLVGGFRRPLLAALIAVAGSFVMIVLFMRLAYISLPLGAGPFRIPGEPMDVPLLWDGYEMTRKGQAAKALGWSLAAAFIGGMVSAVVMVALAKPVAGIALSFSSPEFFSAVFFGLMSVVALSGGSMVNALISLCIGLLIATVGVDSIYGAERFAFGFPFLLDGIEFLLVMVGAYGIGEVPTRMHTGFTSEAGEGTATESRFRTALPRLAELLEVKFSLLRGTLTGIVVGIIPGAGATVSAFVAYGLESQYGKNRARLGTGAPEGIVAAKSAATASVGGALVPLLTMGIPGSGATAIMLAAFLLHGIQPGPQVFVSNAALIYTIFAAVFLSVIGMCMLGYIAIKPLCKVFDAPEAIVSAFVVVFCFVGAFAARNNLSDLYVIAVFGLVGFLFERFRFPIAPLVLGTILGPLAETNFMTMMVSFDNDWAVLFTRPISAPVMGMAIVALVWPIVRAVHKQFTSGGRTTP